MLSFAGARKNLYLQVYLDSCVSKIANKQMIDYLAENFIAN